MGQTPEWKLAETLAQLQIEHRNLVIESQRLTRIIYGIDPKLLDTHPPVSTNPSLADPGSMGGLAHV